MGSKSCSNRRRVSKPVGDFTTARLPAKASTKLFTIMYGVYSRRMVCNAGLSRRKHGWPTGKCAVIALPCFLNYLCIRS